MPTERRRRMIRQHNGSPPRTRSEGSIWVRWMFTAVMSLAVVTESIGAPLERSSFRTSSALPDLQLRIVTSDNPPLGGGHLAPGGSSVRLPGMPAPLNPDGVVSLVDNNAGVFCTGGLICNRYVLTTAHCVESASTLPPVCLRGRCPTSSSTHSTTVHWKAGTTSPSSS